MAKEMNLETFGNIMDEFIKQQNIQMLMVLPEGSITAEVTDNCNCGSVLQFYIVLNGMQTIANQLKKEMGIDGDLWVNVVDGLLELMRKDLLETAEDE